MVVELSEFILEYRPRGPIIAQILANFIVELSPMSLTINRKKNGHNMLTNHAMVEGVESE